MNTPWQNRMNISRVSFHPHLQMKWSNNKCPWISAVVQNKMALNTDPTASSKRSRLNKLQKMVLKQGRSEDAIPFHTKSSSVTFTSPNSKRNSTMP